MKIAVVGAGLAGLCAAWLLGRKHQVSLFERQARPGFTAASVSVPGPGADQADAAQRVDVPLRVFYPGYYPTLTRLYQALGVASEPVNYAATFCGPDGRPYFRYRNLLLGQASYSWLAPQDLWLGARARCILRELLRFYRQAPRALAKGQLRHTSLAELLARGGYAPEFVQGLLLPAICTVCTCNHAQALAFPAEVVVGYLSQGLSRQAVKRALHGADDVQQRLLQGPAQLHCNARIGGVRRTAQGVQLLMEDGSLLDFDHLVLATQANQARQLLLDAQPEEAAALDGFSYSPVEVLTHRDSTLMPAQRRDWSPVNLWCAPAHDAPESTIWINAVHPGLRQAAPVFQTVNPLRQPRPDTLLGQARFERPVVNAASTRALASLLALHGQAGRRLWFCGSYAQAGIPLLESAALSAHDLAARLNASEAPG